MAIALEKYGCGATTSIYLVFLSLSSPLLFSYTLFLSSPCLSYSNTSALNFAMGQTEKALEAESSPDVSPDISRPFPDEKFTSHEVPSLQLPPAAVGNTAKVSSVLTVFVAGVALFSDGYNAQIIGYMQPLFADL